MIYTVGNEISYDKGLKRDRPFFKIGRNKDYPGGFAVKSVEDANRLIKEFDKEGEWAVYEIDADWDKDTTMSFNGWWHALLKDSIVIRKIPVEINENI